MITRCALYNKIGLPVLAAIIVLTLSSTRCNAQDYDVSVSNSIETPTYYRIALEWVMPKEDAQYYNKRFGTEELQKEAQQFVNKWIRDRIANEKDNDARRAWKFVPEATKQKGIQDEQAYRDTVGTWRSQQQID